MGKVRKEEKLQKLYSLAMNSAQSLPPKRALFAWKCPKCGGKLDRESLKEMIFAGEGGSEFANKVISEAGLPQGVYNLRIDHFTCKCDYEFAKRTIESPRETA
jgi:hypothetical protein